MLHDVTLDIVFEEDIKEIDAERFAAHYVGATFMGISPIVSANIYCGRHNLCRMVFRVNISHDMSTQVGGVILTHHIKNIPQIKGTKLISIVKVPELGKVKIIITKEAVA